MQGSREDGVGFDWAWPLAKHHALRLGQYFRIVGCIRTKVTNKHSRLHTHTHTTLFTGKNNSNTQAYPAQFAYRCLCLVPS